MHMDSTFMIGSPSKEYTSKALFVTGQVNLSEQVYVSFKKKLKYLFKKLKITTTPLQLHTYHLLNANYLLRQFYLSKMFNAHYLT